MWPGMESTAIRQREPAASEKASPVRSLAVVEYVSLDGVIQAPGHAGEDRDGGFAHGGWSSSTAEFMADHRRYNSQLFPTAGAFLLGRRTYEIFAGYWPMVTDQRDQIAQALNSRSKFVVSTTLREAAWPGTRVLTGDVPGESRQTEARVRRPGPGSWQCHAGTRSAGS